MITFFFKPFSISPIYTNRNKLKKKKALPWFSARQKYLKSRPSKKRIAQSKKITEFRVPTENPRSGLVKRKKKRNVRKRFTKRNILQRNSVFVISEYPAVFFQFSGSLQFAFWPKNRQLPARKQNPVIFLPFLMI